MTSHRAHDKTKDKTKDSAIRRRVFIGTTSNFIGQIFVFVVSFLLTPFILNSLGATIYGLWILLGSIVAYSSVLDLGIWGTIIITLYSGVSYIRRAAALFGGPGDSAL